MRIVAGTILMLLLLAPWAAAQDAPEPAPAPTDTEVVEPVVTPEPAAKPETDNAARPEPPKGPPLSLGGPAKMKADAVVREQREGVLVIQFTGHVELMRGSSLMEADRAVAWIDEAKSAELKTVVMDVYAEGGVVTTEENIRSKSPATFFRWGSSEFTVDDVDGFIDEAKEPLGGDLMARAELGTADRTIVRRIAETWLSMPVNFP